VYQDINGGSPEDAVMIWESLPYELSEVGWLTVDVKNELSSYPLESGNWLIGVYYHSGCCFAPGFDADTVGGDSFVRYSNGGWYYFDPDDGTLMIRTAAYYYEQVVGQGAQEEAAAAARRKNLGSDARADSRVKFKDICMSIVMLKSRNTNFPLGVALRFGGSLRRFLESSLIGSLIAERSRSACSTSMMP